MASFSPVSITNKKTVGFVVEDTWNGGTYFVGVDKLFLSNMSVMFKDKYVWQGGEWYERLFIWGVPTEETLVKKFKQLNIDEVSEIPDWVGKDYEAVKKEIATLKEEMRKRSWLYKLTHLFAKKE
jgi:hypothetical protein